MIVCELGRFASRIRYEDLPADVVDAIKLRILDLLGVALLGAHFGTHKRLLPILNGIGKSTVLAFNETRSLRDSVLLNSFAAHALYLEDGSRYTGGHPSSVVIPSAFAVAEIQHSSGREFIAAIAAGYEVFLRLGRAIYPSIVERGFKSTAVLGAVSSAAACANLLRFTPDVAKNALAIACSLGVGLKEALQSSSSDPLQVARACEGGLIAALFAKQGAQGPNSIIENGFIKAFSDGADTADMLAGLGIHFGASETYLKLHAGCRGNHASIDIVQNLIKTHGFDHTDIDRIKIRVDSVTFAADFHEVENADQAQFSVAFSIAVALIEGDASVFQYTDARVLDPRIRLLMTKIDVTPDPALDEGFPHRRGARVEITMRDGRHLYGSLDNARGEPEYPFSRNEIQQKFMNLAGKVLGSQTENICDAIMEVDHLDDLSVLATQLRNAQEA